MGSLVRGQKHPVLPIDFDQFFETNRIILRITVDYPKIKSYNALDGDTGGFEELDGICMLTYAITVLFFRPVDPKVKR